jgi:hypothetical protein
MTWQGISGHFVPNYSVYYVDYSLSFLDRIAVFGTHGSDPVVVVLYL